MLKILKKTCKFCNVCSGFRSNSLTCINGGGEYCGMFRRLSIEKEKSNDKM
jgi:hypothetical protein